MSSVGEFPFYYQRGTFGCGLASLKMVMDYYGKKINLMEIKSACGISGRGAFLADLETALKEAQKVGAESCSYEGARGMMLQ